MVGQEGHRRRRAGAGTTPTDRIWSSPPKKERPPYWRQRIGSDASASASALSRSWLRFTRRRHRLSSTSSMRSKAKAARIAFAGLLTLHVLLALFDRLLLRHGPPGSDLDLDGAGPARSAEAVAVASDESFAVVINTFKRPERLRRTVRHYAESCGRSAGVGAVYVSWGDVAAEAPDPASFFPSDASPPSNTNTAGTRGADSRASSTRRRPSSNRAPVVVVKRETSSLNGRFEPIEQLTSGASFHVDDDVKVDCASLEVGFKAWRHSNYAMVGYYPRIARSSGSGGDLVYGTWPGVYLSSTYNFVLTKAAFLHARYLTLYGRSDFREVRDHVDRVGNCEDVAMAALVANYTRFENGGAPALPVYVEGRAADEGLFGGISTGPSHYATRSKCVRIITDAFAQKGWPPPLDYRAKLGESSWIRHGYWWQYRPSNFFEWFAFQGVF